MARETTSLGLLPSCSKHRRAKERQETPMCTGACILPVQKQQWCGYLLWYMRMYCMQTCIGRLHLLLLSMSLASKQSWGVECVACTFYTRRWCVAARCPDLEDASSADATCNWLARHVSYTLSVHALASVPPRLLIRTFVPKTCRVFSGGQCMHTAPSQTEVSIHQTYLGTLIHQWLTLV